MDKSVLSGYIDACELIKETEEDIRKLQEKKSMIVKDSVKGSMNEFPYTEKTYHLEGNSHSYMDEMMLRCEEDILKERKINAEAIKGLVEKWMNATPVRMQRIIRYRYFEGLSWEEVADRMGRKSTENGLKKEFERFMKES